MTDSAVYWGVLVLAYFFPSIMGALRGHHNWGSALIVNLFLGWTVIGWVIALAMVANRARRPA